MVLLVDFWWIRNYSTNWSVQRSEWTVLVVLWMTNDKLGSWILVEWSEMIVTNIHWENWFQQNLVQALTSKSQQIGHTVPCSDWLWFGYVCLGGVSCCLCWLHWLCWLCCCGCAQHWVSDCCNFVFVWPILDLWGVHMMFILWGDCNPSNACWLLEVVFVWQNVVCDRIVRFSNLWLNFRELVCGEYLWFWLGWLILEWMRGL